MLSPFLYISSFEKQERVFFFVVKCLRGIHSFIHWCILSSSINTALFVVDDDDENSDTGNPVSTAHEKNVFF
jgi:hypothetical protein